MDRDLQPIPMPHPVIGVLSLLVIVVLLVLGFRTNFSTPPPVVDAIAVGVVVVVCEWSRRRNASRPHRRPEPEIVLNLDGQDRP